jgi:hypothetical protein
MDPIRALVVERLRCGVESCESCKFKCNVSILPIYMWQVVTHTCRVKRRLNSWNACNEEIYRLYADSVMINAVVETGCYPYEFWLLSRATQKLMEKKCEEMVEVSDDLYVYIFSRHFLIFDASTCATAIFSLDTGENCRLSYTSCCLACNVIFFGGGKLPGYIEKVVRHYVDFYDVYRFFEEGK